MRSQRVAEFCEQGRELGQGRALLRRSSLGAGSALRGWGEEAGVEAKAADQGRAPRWNPGQSMGKRVDSEARVADEDDPASGQPATELQHALARPIGEELVPAARFRIRAFGRREQRQHRQRLDACRPGNGREHHEAQPAQAAGLDEMPVAGAHRVAIDATRGDARAPAPLDGVVEADDHRTLRHQGGDNQIEQGAGQRAALPAPAVQHLMVDGEVGGIRPSGHAQAGADGALARSEQRAHDQNEQVPPGRPGDMRAKRLQPQAENSGDGIAARGGSDRMVLHPMLRIPRRTPHNTISLRRIDSPICRRRVATARGGRPTARQEIDAIAAHASTAPFCAKPS